MKRLAIVVGASGSLLSRRSLHALKPAAGPSLACSEASSSELRTESPPPLPKIEPMNANRLTASSIVYGAGRCTAGTFSWMYALTPATQLVKSA